MNTQITLLSDDALDAVAGGMMNIVQEGLPPVPGSTRASGQGSVASGSSSIGPFAVSSAWFAIGAGIIIAAGAA